MDGIDNTSTYVLEIDGNNDVDDTDADDDDDMLREGIPKWK